MSTKYIFITGGVVSGLGKGITAASLGRLLKNRGYKVINQKFDPYINIDPGTMNPNEHGEVFVTDDGAETDLDLGHYERFVDEVLTKNCSMTSGKIYQNVINKERRGDYLGHTVQVIPHITNEIKEKICDFKDKDIVITELGGTVGDIEGLALIEAIRQMGLEKNPEDVMYIHVTLLPYISGSNELKTKPTQHSVKQLQSFGIKPDILVCRSEEEIPQNLKEKIAMFCNVRPENVITNMTAKNLYEIPLMLEKEGLARQVCKHFKLENIEPNNKEWEEMIDNIKNIEKEKTINIAIVGKYTKLEDSYLSVVESIKHAGYYNNVNTKIKFIDSEKITEENVDKKLENIDGVIVPGGFGKRGIEGMITTIKYVRENNIPFLGICLGMQMSVLEFSRNVVGIKDASSEEFDKTSQNLVIHLMEDQKNIEKKGGTMRIGAYPCTIKKNTKAYEIYGSENISQRHRHRFEFNNDYREIIEKNGMVCSGIYEKKDLVEIVEIPKNKFFVAAQFHPEFKSRPNIPEPLFREFIKTSK